MKGSAFYNWSILGIASFWLLLFLCSGCANITSPVGGKKDTTSPKLLSVDPVNKSLNIRPKRIEMRFDEYITVSDASKEVEISPTLRIDPVVTGLYKKVTIKIADTLLEDNTTYRISFGKAIKDLHEGNIYKNYVYTFSTGSYFDSLTLKGSVMNAATGLPDTSTIVVGLYYATENDSAVVRHKPKYITRTNAAGDFVFKGLPKKTFRIYALKDANSNLVYDGKGEMIAFNEHDVTIGDTTMKPIILRLFTEPDDTGIKKTDTVAKGVNKKQVEEPFKYMVNVDTTKVDRRTFDLKNDIKINFSRIVVLNKDKITLAYDSAGTAIPTPIKIVTDTLHPYFVEIMNAWQENMVYTLRLAKGFAKDTSGAEAQPSKYRFKTWEEEDYGKFTIHLPSRYHGMTYLLQVTCEKDTIYQKPVTDTIINFTRYKPAKYTFRIIVDKNHNGRWDSGDLFGKIEPEEVIPYKDVLNLKAGWKEIIDFEQKPLNKSVVPDKK